MSGVAAWAERIGRRNPIRGWNTFEVAWLGAFSLVAVVLSVVWRDSLFGLSVFLTGVLCVVLAAKGSIWTTRLAPSTP